MRAWRKSVFARRRLQVVSRERAPRLQPVVGERLRELSGRDSLGTSVLGRGGKFMTFWGLAGMCLLALGASPLGGGMVRDSGRLY